MCPSSVLFSNPLAPADPDACDGVVSDGDIYTAQLTDGAFIFVGGPIPVTAEGTNDIGLGSVFDVEMGRPTGSDDQDTLDLQATWDDMFYIGCPNLGTAEAGEEGVRIMNIKSTYDNWSIEEPGNYRLILRDIQLQDWEGTDWDVTVQLIGPPNYDPYDDSHWLPTVGDSPHTFVLTRGRMWGREVRGGQGGRMSCYPGGSDIGAFNLGGDSVLEIAIP